MQQFYYVYILRSQKDGRFYVGWTHDLKERLKMHNAGGVTSTKPRRPLDLIFYEAYLNQDDAKRRESYLKTSKGKTSLRVMLAEFLKGSFDLKPDKELDSG
ncbi:MAG: GIY-YIG nuclease family protein [Terriglobia bacterium]